MRWLVVGAMGVAGVCASERAAAHGPHVSDEAAVISLVSFLSDLTFTVVDVVAAAEDRRHNGWVIPQAILSTPQALALGAIEYDDSDFIPVAIPIVVDQLAAFSIYGLASPRVSTTALYGLSWGIGANVALTNNAVALALEGMWARRSVAITELALAAPQLAVAGYAVQSPDDFPRQREAVLALGAWSSAVFVHGLLSLFLYRPKPLPTQETWRLVPSLIDTELALAPALTAAGRF